MATLRQRKPAQQDDDEITPLATPGLNLQIKTKRPQNNANSATPIAWKLLTTIVTLYIILFALVYHAFVHVPTPLPSTAPPHLFSEGRALTITAHLADVIGERQVSTPGEQQAATYLFEHCKQLLEYIVQHRPDLEARVEREFVTGAIGKQRVFHFDIANAYNNLTNIVLRIAPKAARNKPAVLVNAHYDTTIGTVGAADCASCVGVALEIARTIIYNPQLTLKSPIVVLLNGGEETLMQASHGFMQISQFVDQLGAFINLESTGPWGPDVLFQHSGDWTLQAYARSAPFPRGTTLAQDFFDLGLIPGDTDYRMFSYRSYGVLPGIDVATIFDGSAYHTMEDAVYRIRPGTLQAMGENILATVIEFTNVLGGSDDGSGGLGDVVVPKHLSGKVYFDVLARYMVVYSHGVASVVHIVPLVGILVLSLASAAYRMNPPPPLTASSTFRHFILSVPPPPSLLAALTTTTLSVLSCCVCCAAIGGLRVFFTNTPMVWFGRPSLATAIYLPAALAGLLLPMSFTPANIQPGVVMRRNAYGAVFFCSIVSVVLTTVGMHSAYMAFVWAVTGFFAAGFAFTGQVIVDSSGGGGEQYVEEEWWNDTRRIVLVIVSFLPAVLATMAAVITIPLHVMEKISMVGSIPGPLGFFLPDMIVGVVQGIAIVIGTGSFWPYIAGSLTLVNIRKKVTAGLILLSILSSVLTSYAVGGMPYSKAHRKRVVVQHFHHHANDGTVLHSLLSFAAMDPVPVAIALPPPVMRTYRAHKDDEGVKEGDLPVYRGLYPLDNLMQGFSIPGPPLEKTAKTPTLILVKSSDYTTSITTTTTAAKLTQEPRVVEGCKRLYLKLDTVAAAWGLLNISGDVRAWSLGPEVATTPLPSSGSNTTHSSETYGSHMIRYASSLYTTIWSMWVDIPIDSTVYIELFVKYIVRTAELEEVIEVLPEWASPIAVTTMYSVWEF